VPTASPQLAPAFHDVEALTFVLDQMPVGILLVDGGGHVVWTNRYARSRLAAGGALELRGGRLAARWHAETLALQRLVERAAAGGGEPETLALPRSAANGAPLVVVARPIDRLGAAPMPGEACVVLFLSGADHQLRASRQRLRRLFQLTPAECELTALLAAGHSLRSAAGELAITHESARTYLKRALQKTGTRRQAELVRLALSVATAGADER
jgi:DNA-binding CsgD family transcriptional regulator